MFNLHVKIHPGIALGPMLLIFPVLLGLLVSSVSAETFDKPLKQVNVDLGLSPDQRPEDNLHIKLSCSYYPEFMVKELDDKGELGPKWLAIVTSSPAHLPACVQLHGPKEKLLAQNMCEEFWGVKQGLVFLAGCEIQNSILDFSVYDPKTSKQLFQDSIGVYRHASNDIDFVNTSTGQQLRFRYMRAFAGDCSVPQRGAACWRKFQEKVGLNTAPIPRCSGYEGKMADDWLTVFAYPVEVTFQPQPVVKNLHGPIQCWPSE